MQRTIQAFIMSCMLFLGACSSTFVDSGKVNNPAPAPAPAPPPPPPVEEHVPVEEKHLDYSNDRMTGMVTVLFGTNRNRTSSTGCVDSFGKNRGGNISYGYCHVQIPLDHRIGIIESPSWFKFEFKDNPAKHVSIVGGEITSKSDFNKRVSAALKNDGASFIYVHGYNVSFESAAKRTAQMAYDLDFNGVAAFYSWPSAGIPKAYPPDEAAAEAAKISLYNFLINYLENPSVKNVYLIAHSMGNRTVAGALVMVNGKHPFLTGKIKQVILAAPDIDSDVFVNEVVPGIKSAGWPVTMYISGNDLALLASKKFHNYPRAGLISDNVIVVPGVDTVDATGISTDLIGHSYYGDSSTLIYDIHSIIMTGDRAAHRFRLSKVKGKSGVYWRFNP